MAVVDTLITRFQADTGNYEQGTRKVSASTQSLNGVMAQSSATLAGLSASMSGGGLAAAVASGAFVIAGAAMAAIGLAAAGAVKGTYELGKAGVIAAMNMERMEAGLMTVASSAAEAEMMMARLREVAKLPGLGLQEAIQGTTRLMAAGFDFAAAERAMRGFGNALASVGGGRAELDGVLMALTQIAAKGVVSAEEINQIAERVPQIRGLMAAAFGTASTEALGGMGISSETFIMGIIGELEKLPAAASTFSNSLENLVDSANTALASLGSGIASALIPEMEKVAGFFTYLADSKVLANIGDGLGRVIGVSDGGSLLIRAGSILIAALEAMPSILAVFQAVITSALVSAQSLLSGALAAYNSFASGPVGRLLGFEHIATGQGKLAAVIKIGAELGSGILDRAGQIEAGFNTAPGSGLTPATGGSVRSFGSPAPVPANEEDKAQTRILQTIEANTRPEIGPAEAFGGGRLGRMGVTPADLSDMRARRGGRGFADALARIIGEEMARQVDSQVADMARYGMLRTS